ncbi:DUF4355 domain-containing protein [Lysinibacillus sp. G01H]|uniref:DUF4355 domain-containing protein n=1 Tax=Lysinibacillus sp. G01H TaxID=3026425 RepID=UPI00237E2572|nr:DUF4355 domain-containing protein [Lysinibacillus sp. G01H]WDU77562.1 DUF4355 domain-containing protein [Lysinibacillus sp. G01H]
MNQNPFNLKTLIPLDIQMLAGEGDPNPEPTPEPTPEPASGGNGQGATLTLESVQSFLNDDDEGKKWLQSFADTRVTDAIKTYETKTLPKKLEDEISKRYPPESEEAKQLRELKAQFEQSQKEAAREKLFNQALSTATEKSLPAKLVGFFVGDDAEKTTANLGILENINFKGIYISFFPYKIVPVQTFFIYIFTNWGTILKKLQVPQQVPQKVPQLNTFR